MESGVIRKRPTSKPNLLKRIQQTLSFSKYTFTVPLTFKLGLFKRTFPVYHNIEAGKSGCNNCFFSSLFPSISPSAFFGRFDVPPQENKKTLRKSAPKI